MSGETSFRWAILGTGVVSRRFVLDLSHAGATAAIVASRNPENAARFAESLHVPQTAETYEDAVAADVDAVYVATPPALHEEHALLAIGAGKPVLVEKPFAVDAAAAARIRDAARAAGVPCIEALWTRFQPFAAAARAAIAAGQLGTPTAFEARFMAANAPDPENSVFSRALGGGALLHRGVYPLSLARDFLGPIAEMHPVARLGETGVDEDSVLVLRHTSGAISTLRASLRATGPDGAFIAGTGGTLYLEGPIYRPTGAILFPTKPAAAGGGGGGVRRFEALRESTTGQRLSGVLQRLRRARAGQRLGGRLIGNGYHYQVKAMKECVANDLIETAEMPLDQSVEVMELIDQARAAWGTLS